MLQWPNYYFLVLSDTPDSMRQGGDRGNFYMVLNGGNNSSSELIQLNRQDAYFEPGHTYNFMTLTHNLGHVHSADLIWQYKIHPLNPLTWRMKSVSTLYINRLVTLEITEVKITYYIVPACL